MPLVTECHPLLWEQNPIMSIHQAGRSSLVARGRVKAPSAATHSFSPTLVFHQTGYPRFFNHSKKTVWSEAAREQHSYHGGDNWCHSLIYSCCRSYHPSGVRWSKRTEMKNSHICLCRQKAAAPVLRESYWERYCRTYKNKSATLDMISKLFPPL